MSGKEKLKGIFAEDGDRGLGPKEFKTNPAELLPHPITEIKSAVPNPELIEAAVNKIALTMSLRDGSNFEDNKKIALEQLIDSSHRSDRDFLRWDLTRRTTGGTGFEKFGAGRYENNKAMAESIATMGAEILKRAKESAFRENNPTFMSRLWKFIDVGAYDADVISFLDSTLGSLLATLKVQAHGAENVTKAGEVIYDATANIEPIEYGLESTNKGIKQIYNLPSLEVVQIQLGKLLPIGEAIDPSIFRGDKYWGYILMLKLGSIGHPLVRAAIRTLSA